jgi:hypothetical protein
VSDTRPNEAEFCRTLRATIGAARHAIADGAVIDLAGFDGEVAALCAAAAQVAEPARAALRDELTGLLADLDELAASLAAQNAPPSDGDAAHQRAARAYAPGKVD